MATRRVRSHLRSDDFSLVESPELDGSSPTHKDIVKRHHASYLHSRCRNPPRQDTSHQCPSQLSMYTDSRVLELPRIDTKVRPRQVKTNGTSLQELKQKRQSRSKNHAKQFDEYLTKRGLPSNLHEVSKIPYDRDIVSLPELHRAKTLEQVCDQIDAEFEAQANMSEDSHTPRQDPMFGGDFGYHESMRSVSCDPRLQSTKMSIRRRRKKNMKLRKRKPEEQIRRDKIAADPCYPLVEKLHEMFQYLMDEDQHLKPTQLYRVISRSGVLQLPITFSLHDADHEVRAVLMLAYNKTGKLTYKQTRVVLRRIGVRLQERGRWTGKDQTVTEGSVHPILQKFLLSDVFPGFAAIQLEDETGMLNPGEDMMCDKNALRVMERYEKATQRIFFEYCKARMLEGSDCAEDYELWKHKMSSIDLDEITQFAKEFGFFPAQLNIVQLKKLFKDSNRGLVADAFTNELSLREFNQFLGRLANLLFDDEEEFADRLQKLMDSMDDGYYEKFQMKLKPSPLPRIDLTVNDHDEFDEMIREEREHTDTEWFAEDSSSEESDTNNNTQDMKRVIRHRAKNKQPYSTYRKFKKMGAMESVHKDIYVTSGGPYFTPFEIELRRRREERKQWLFGPFRVLPPGAEQSRNDRINPGILPPGEYVEAKFGTNLRLTDPDKFMTKHGFRTGFPPHYRS